MTKYVKRPVVIEAESFSKDTYLNSEFLKDVIIKTPEDIYIIPTLEGNMKVSEGDYVIKGVQGEFYPCKPDIFEQTYEALKVVPTSDMNI